MNNKLFKMALLALLTQLALTHSPILNPYQQLGLHLTSSKQQVKKAFKQLSLQFHPDRNPHNPLRKQRYHKIIQAYQLIKQEWSEAGQQSSYAHPTFIKIDDLLDQMSWEKAGDSAKPRKGFVRWCFANPEVVLAAFCLSMGLVIACR